MKICFYFDPGCPWCWITSRWITQIEKDRDVVIEFKPFSLALKNDILNSDDDDGEFIPEMKRAHKLLRVIARLMQDNDSALVRDFYTKVGEKIHIESDNTLGYIGEVLQSLGVDESIVNASEDQSYDKFLQENIDDAISVVGQDAGVPIFVIEDDKGKRGFFGPVISSMPSKEQGLALWDGIVAMSTFPHFYELKRTRNVGPDTMSTKDLLS